VKLNSRMVGYKLVTVLPDSIPITTYWLSMDDRPTRKQKKKELETLKSLRSGLQGINEQLICLEEDLRVVQNNYSRYDQVQQKWSSIMNGICDLALYLPTTRNNN